MDPLSPLKKTAERFSTDRRRRPTAHPWADAYLRAHGIQDAGLRAEILAAVLARTARRRTESRRPEDESDLVMEETQRFLDEQLASFVGGLAPDQPCRRRAAGVLAGGRARAGARRPARRDPRPGGAALPDAHHAHPEGAGDRARLDGLAAVYREPLPAESPASSSAG